MINLLSEEYIKFSDIVKTRRKHLDSWDNIKCLGQSNENELKRALDMNSTMHGIGCISVQDWYDIVEHVKNDEDISISIVEVPAAVIPAASPEPQFKVNNNKGSAWYSYKTKLIEKKFDSKTIDSIEQSSIDILNKLSLNTKESGPIKGLVIGNVQSGKTANMAALMSMAADAGWNLFIVLSGTIENLRIQTQERLLNDLSGPTNVSWVALDNVNNNPNNPHLLSKLQLKDNQRHRYFMVCLKNSTRLGNLLTWLQGDNANRSRLKIVVIDDEADQAGINSKRKIIQDKNDPDEIERTAINKKIVNLLNNKNDDNEYVDTKFQSLNYVAYTATPYANILDEKPGPSSLYPENFVASLGSSNLYFGPQQIFGLESNGIDGLDIINDVIDSDCSNLKLVHEKKTNKMPKSLEDSILWFYCCLSISRYWGYKKPISMLIHTSSQQPHHEAVSDLILNWFNGLQKHIFLEKCKKVYDEQCKLFSLNDFINEFSNYGKLSEVKDYPPFSEIYEFLVDLYNKRINRIYIDEDGEFSFSKGVHLCVDNCKHSFIENGNEHIRLVYPQKQLDYSTGFIVIGGATLSRGLTIEGLVSTYFLRTVHTADTLMQMGRWFGYRIGYELLPRIWIHKECKDKFKFLSELDYELRQRMKYMEINGIKPGMVGISIRQYSSNKLEITSKNKQKAATILDKEFFGLATQTTMFFEDNSELLNNLNTANAFISSLGEETILKDRISSDSTHVWLNVNGNDVINFIKNLNFPNKDSRFIDVKNFDKWYSDLSSNGVLNCWNVAIAGTNDGVEETLGGVKVKKVSRSKKKQDNKDGIIRIGALRAPDDLYLDVDLSNKSLTTDDINYIKGGYTSDFQDIRKRCGLGKTCLLIIYLIDKDSKPKDSESKKREPLDTKVDVVGITLVLPGKEGNDNKNIIHVGIDMNLDELSDEQEGAAN